MEEQIEKDADCHQFCSTCITNALPRKPWKGLETQNAGHIIHTVKYADDLVLLAKEEKVLQAMIDKLIENGGCYMNGNECGINKSSENFKTTIPSKNYDRTRTTRECGIF